MTEARKENTAIIQDHFEHTAKSFGMANENFKSMGERLSLIESALQDEEYL